MPGRSWPSARRHSNQIVNPPQGQRARRTWRAFCFELKTAGRRAGDDYRRGSSHRSMREIVSLIAFLLVICCAAHAQMLAAGTVHGSVTVSADPSNSYALYLPSAYSPVKRWPLLLVFDPFARGETGVKLFHDAAEKYGFIVVGSNNSRNFQDPSDAIRLLWKDVKERYTVDPRRIYTAGLSGGARVASSLA